MSIEFGVDWQGFDVYVTITEWDDELLPITGTLELDGKFDTDSIQDKFLRTVSTFIKENHDDIFNEIFEEDKNIEEAYSQINEHLAEEQADYELERQLYLRGGH